jgi:hypothetical protein
MKLRVKVRTWPKTIGDGDNERVMVQPGMNLVGLRQGGCAVAARGRRAGEKRR